MAKYRALTTIRHGEHVDGDHVVKEFSEGDVVSGLPKEFMQQLWDMGLLEKVVEEPKPVEDPAGTTPTDPAAQQLEPSPDGNKITEEPPKE